MPDEPSLREKALEAIRNGKLPTRKPDRMFGGPSLGETCAVCDEPTTRGEAVLELDILGDVGYRCHLHPRCYAAWEFVRTKVVPLP